MVLGLGLGILAALMKMYGNRLLRYIAGLLGFFSNANLNTTCDYLYWSTATWNQIYCYRVLYFGSSNEGAYWPRLFGQVCLLIKVKRMHHELLE